jgi:hypothetical protein
MADIVLGVGCSHSPLLATPPEQWDLRAADDRRNPAHHFRGKVFTYDALERLRAPESLAEYNRVEIRRERHARNQRSLAILSERIRAARLDVLIVIGDDQHEVLLDDNLPAFLVFTGAEVPFRPTSPERLAAMSEGIRIANWARVPERDMMLPGAAELGRHVVECAIAEGFDIAVSDRLLPRPGAETGLGHAFGFYYHRLLDDLRDMPGLRTLPVFINTFYPPNQPRVSRVYDLGRAIGRAISAWPVQARVGIAASGGFSHFVIDEALDRRLLEAFAGRDAAAILATPESAFQSGTSEIKNWIAALGALEQAGLEFELVDYVPCYRSPAGTGNAMAFAVWQ